MIGKAFAALLALIALPALAADVSSSGPNTGDHDPYLWLSDIHGARAMGWAKQQTEKSDALLRSTPLYSAVHAAVLASLDVKDRIPTVRLDHGMAYNFWQDAAHVRGVWRRTSIADYRSGAPHWQTLIDLDGLDAREKTDFVWQGATCAPGGKTCLIQLSPGGGDAAIVREFDLKTREFVRGGFSLKLAKLQTALLDADTLLVATDFGAGSMTRSSYPRIVKLWKRGTPLAAAKTVFTATRTDIAASPAVFHGPYGSVALVEQALTFFTSRWVALKPDGGTMALPLPQGAVIRGVTQGYLIFTTRDAWRSPDGHNFAQGALAAFNVRDFARGAAPRFALLYTPGATSTVEDVGAGRDAVYAAIFENVVGTIHVFHRQADGHWQGKTLPMPTGGSTAVSAVDAWGPEAQFTFESYLTPPTLYQTDGTAAPRAIKSQKPVFDASGLAADQHWAVSKDGTRIPYFLIHKKGRTGPVPTILYAYGGFELSLFPIYWNDGHRPLAPWTWIERGGALAIANIRGGGEFGPAWHQAALKEHRQRAFDDFTAVARDLQKRGVTTPKQTGIVGASNGGVLVTVTMTQHPELVGAVVAQRPLVDMLRYTRFGAGASWVAEYGDPAIPVQRAYLARYSAYQNVKPDVAYPPALFITETSDDRVTPVWARMMAAKMQAQGHDVLFNEDAEGGHGPGATNRAQADMWALTYAYFGRELGVR
jgi:prolyl oligopeptidase